MAAVPINKPASSLIVRAMKKKPNRILIYGPEKIGKTTFAVDSGAVFIAPEDGFGERTEVPHFPMPEGGWRGAWPQLIAYVESLLPGGTEHGAFDTFAIDSLDWVQDEVLVPFLLKKNGWNTPEDSPYQSIWKHALEEWRKLLGLLERLRDAGVRSVLIAHTLTKKFENPEGADFQRYSLSMNEKAATHIKRWVDVLLFANTKTIVDVDDKTKRAKAIGGTTRVLHTERKAAFDAGNRLGLPAEMPLSWAEFEAAERGEGAGARAEKMADQIKAAVAELGDADTTSKTMSWLPTAVAYAKSSGDLKGLVETLNKLNTRLQERAQTETSNTSNKETDR